MPRKTKIDLVMAIIDILEEGLGLDSKNLYHFRDVQQLKLQKLHNDRLKSILFQLEEGLICRKYLPGRGYCTNLQIKNDSYCQEHSHLSR